MALAFDRSDLFALDKPAGTPCPNLRPDSLCAIHDNLSARGFEGCVRYDCHGAGQVVVQDLFAGRAWQDEPALLAPMMEAFRALRRAQELRLLLETARRLPLSPAQQARRQDLDQALAPPEGWTRETLAAFETGPLPAEVQAFLTSLRDQAAALRR